ncbi:YARHG domain-containing protein [Butyrivibrio sp. AE3004]|uniref:YARHG domain-containing protein n=1 Tax=Butyrivibrio sp. AE3004 TaxID=1506994 RepID=UPI0004940F19|nr:YARHG domain-containing protein [Butyrivibrio sp. AE3004]
MREPILDGRNTKIGEYEERLDGRVYIYDRKNNRIGEIRGGVRRLDLYDRNNRKLAFWDEDRDCTRDIRNRKLSDGNSLLQVCVMLNEEQIEAQNRKEQEEAQKRKEKEDANKRKEAQKQSYERGRKTYTTGKKGSTRGSGKKNGSAGGGLILLILIVIMFRACSKNTTQEPKNEDQNISVQHKQVAKEQSEQDKQLDIRTESDFIFSDSDKRYLSDDEVKTLNKDEIRIAINEIYARRGRAFKTPELNEYFSSKNWYNPQYSQAEFSEDVFNEYEKANIILLSKYR